jgi:hypothetical protein
MQGFRAISANAGRTAGYDDAAICVFLSHFVLSCSRVSSTVLDSQGL